MLTGATVVEFPSGKRIGEITIPRELGVENLAFDGEFVTGYTLGGLFRMAGTKYTVHQWDAKTGAYRGPSERTLTEAWRAGEPNPTAERWIERGNRAVRTKGAKVEVWDAARRGPTDRPLFTCTTDGLCTLNNTGTRLIVSSPKRFTLFCTTTGREVLSLPSVPHSYFCGWFAYWNPEGQLWYGVEGDGKPIGIDFRPREQK